MRVTVFGKKKGCKPRMTCIDPENKFLVCKQVVTQFPTLYVLSLYRTVIKGVPAEDATLKHD